MKQNYLFYNLVKTERKTKNCAQWLSFRHKMQREAGKLGLFELEFAADRRAYRVLAMFDGSMRVVIVCICYKKGRTWTPANAEATAINRAKLVLAKKAKLNVIHVEDNL